MLGANATTRMPSDPPVRPMTIQGRRMPRCEAVRLLIRPKNGLLTMASRAPTPVTNAKLVGARSIPTSEFTFKARLTRTGAMSTRQVPMYARVYRAMKPAPTGPMIGGRSQRRERGRQAQHAQDPPCHPVPAGPTAPQPGRELEGAEAGVRDCADDVHDHRHGGRCDARVGGHQLRATGQPDQSQGAEEGGEQDKGHQRERHPPGRGARLGRSGGPSRRLGGHLASAGSSCGLTGMGRA